MEYHFSEMVQQHSRGTLDHALGLPCRPRGEHDVDRVVRRQLLEVYLLIVLPREEVIIVNCARNAADISPFPFLV